MRGSCIAMLAALVLSVPTAALAQATNNNLSNVTTNGEKTIVTSSGGAGGSLGTQTPSCTDAVAGSAAATADQIVGITADTNVDIESCTGGDSALSGSMRGALSGNAALAAKLSDAGVTADQVVAVGADSSGKLAVFVSAR